MGRLTRLLLVVLSLGAIIGAVVISEPAPRTQTISLTSYPQETWVHKLAAPKPVAPQAPTTYTVVAGDTLSGIGQRFGHSWQSFAGYNSLTEAQAQDIIPGQKLKIPPPGYTPPALHISTTPQVRSEKYVSNTYFSSSVWACIARVENGGSYGRSSNPTHFGRYQFDRGSWAEFGGNPRDWGYASPVEQDAVFARAEAAGASYLWTPYDRC